MNKSLLVKKYTPLTLTVAASIGVIGTAVLAVKATPKAIAILDWHDIDVKEDPVKAFKMTWKLYIPAAVMGAFTIACVISNNQVQAKRGAALLGAYSMLDNQMRQYRKNVIDVLGTKEEVKIQDKVNEETLNNNPPEKHVYYDTSSTPLCYDSLSGRYFRKDIEDVRKAMNDFNQELTQDQWLPLNSFYNFLGIPETVLGDEFGWASDSLMDLHFSSKLSENGIPCIVIDYNYNPPKNWA